MKNIMEKYDPFLELAKYERMTLCYSLPDLEQKAGSTSLIVNQKELHDIKMILLLTSRYFLVASALFGYCLLPIIYHFVFGWSISMIKFLTISGIVFPFYFYLIYDRWALLSRNVLMRSFLKQYTSVLKKVIESQRQTEIVNE